MWQAGLWSALTLLLCINITQADTWKIEDCFCASSTKVGWVRQQTWSSFKFRIHSFYSQASAPRSGMKKDIIGQRCKNGTTTEDCVNIPDMNKHNIWYYYNPTTPEKNCYTFNDGIELCGTVDHIRVNGKHQPVDQGWPMKEFESLDCHNVCNTEWNARDSSTIDACNVTSFEPGPLRGQQISVRYKAKKDGKLKQRKKSYECGGLVIDFDINQALSRLKPLSV